MMAIWGEGTRDVHIISFGASFCILSRPAAPSSSPIHRKPLCNFALAARLSVSQSWQTSLHSRSQNTDESVLGKWQGRRPLPAWSLDQGSLYPAIYPLWTRGVKAGGEMMSQMTGEMKLSIKRQLKQKRQAGKCSWKDLTKETTALSVTCIFPLQSLVFLLIKLILTPFFFFFNFRCVAGINAQI